MRHKHKGNRLSRKSSHRLSLLQNLSSDLILHESVETTLAKAKELKRYAEKMITKAKVDQLKIDIEKNEREIDQMVYELYGLTKEEIEIIENN